MAPHRLLLLLVVGIALIHAGCHSHRHYPYQSGGYPGMYQQPAYVSQGAPIYQGGPIYDGGGAPMMGEPMLGPPGPQPYGPAPYGPNGPGPYGPAPFGEPTPAHPGLGPGVTRPTEPRLGSNSPSPGNPYYQEPMTVNPRVPNYPDTEPFKANPTAPNVTKTPPAKPPKTPPTTPSPYYDRDVPPTSPMVTNPLPPTYQDGTLSPPPATNTKPFPPATNTKPFPPATNEPFQPNSPGPGTTVPFGTEPFQDTEEPNGGFFQENMQGQLQPSNPPNLLQSPPQIDQVAFEGNPKPFEGNPQPFDGAPQPFEGDPEPFAETPNAGDQPNPYAFDPQGYRWLRGVVDFDPDQREWFILYDLTPSSSDRYGGELTLMDDNSQKFQLLQPGKVVLVEGQIDPTSLDKQGKPSYRVRNLALLQPKN